MAMPDPFATVAAQYEEWYATPLGRFVIAEQERALLDALPATPGTLLEVGAGTGWWCRRLAGHGWRVTAVEPSAEMRAVGAAATPATWLEGTAEQLPVDDGTFDAVLLTTVLEFVTDPARAMSEAWRSLRPGGGLVVGLLDARSPWAALYRHLADQGVDPWSAARFVVPATVAGWLGRPADLEVACVHLAPDAQPPFAEAEVAGRRAGNRGALTVLRWDKPR